MLTQETFEQFIQQDLPYQQRLVSRVDQHGLQHWLEQPSDLYRYLTDTIKVEGMERYSPEVRTLCLAAGVKYHHAGPVTCHAFLAQQGSGTFDLHTDPDDVLIYVISGTKIMEISGQEIILHAGGDVFIPRGTPHRAINRYPSLMLSIGLEGYLQDKL